jgi:hypothetical protein
MPERQTLVSFKEYRNRARLAKMIIELFRTWHQIANSVGNASALDNQHFGSDLDIFFVYLAVLVGDFEKRPMNLSDVSHYVGLPRPTVYRKINLLLAAGAIERKDNFYLLAPNMVVPDKGKLWAVVKRHLPPDFFPVHFGHNTD